MSIIPIEYQIVSCKYCNSSEVVRYSTPKAVIPDFAARNAGALEGCAAERNASFVRISFDAPPSPAHPVALGHRALHQLRGSL